VRPALGAADESRWARAPRSRPVCPFSSPHALQMELRVPAHLVGEIRPSALTSRRRERAIEVQAIGHALVRETPKERTRKPRNLLQDTCPRSRSIASGRVWLDARQFRFRQEVPVTPSARSNAPRREAWHRLVLPRERRPRRSQTQRSPRRMGTSRIPRPAPGRNRGAIGEGRGSGWADASVAA
jgi:hypothetical protein